MATEGALEGPKVGLIVDGAVLGAVLMEGSADTEGAAEGETDIDG